MSLRRGDHRSPACRVVNFMLLRKLRPDAPGLEVDAHAAVRERLDAATTVDGRDRKRP